MNNYFRAAIVVVAIGAFATGCGEDDDALSAAEFREEANAVCIEGEQDLFAAAGPVFGNNAASPEELREALDAVVSISRRQFDDIDALAVPGDLADRVDELLAEGRAATDSAEAQGLGFFESDGDPWARTTELALALGLDGCGGG